MDEQRRQELLSSSQAQDFFTKLCRFFGGGGSPAFWAAVRCYDWASAAALCEDAPKVPQRTRLWLNRDAARRGYHPYLPMRAHEE
jgi:hypothetical protein